MPTMRSYFGHYDLNVQSDSSLRKTIGKILLNMEITKKTLMRMIIRSGHVRIIGGSEYVIGSET